MYSKYVSRCFLIIFFLIDYGSDDVHMFVTLQRVSHIDTVAWNRMSGSDIALQNCQAVLFIHELEFSINGTLAELPVFLSLSV